MAADPTPDVAVFDDPRIEAFGMLVEAHNELTRVIDHGLAEVAELPVPWLGVLIRLARSPDQRLRMSALATDMTMSNSGLTRLIDRVEQAGHVRREACPGDRRGTFAVLTADGLRVAQEAAPRHLEDLQTYLAGAVGDDELAALTAALRRVRDHVRSTTSPT